MHGREQLGIDHAGRLRLLRRFMPGEGLEHRVAREGESRLAQQRLQRRVDAALPIDQRAVAVEGEDGEIGQLHERLRSFVRDGT